VTGEEDRATQGLRRHSLSRALVSSRLGDLRVDLSDCAFADSSLMIDLAMLSRRLRRAGRKLVICDPQPHIQRLIERVGLDRLPGVLVAAPAR
jgi:anti-anti-sigma factor